MHSKRIIDRAPNVRHKVARIEEVSTHGPSRRLVVRGRYLGEVSNTVLDYLIVATGFNPLWFMPLMPEQLKARLSSKTAVERGIETDLSLRGVYPRLHLPMLAGFQEGPGFPNLSCLGLLSDRILRPYARLIPKKYRAPKRTRSSSRR